MDTFHAVTGIVWPPLPPSVSDEGKTTTTNKKKKNSRAAAAAAAIIEPPVPEDTTPGTTTTTSPAATAAAEVALPEEFRLLKDGPPPAGSSMWNGTGGQRFLQMREVGAAAVDYDYDNGAWEGGGGGGGSGASRGGGAGGATAAAAVASPLRKPALGEYVGGCRPNELLVATVVKAHGRRGRVDEACRAVLTMAADWGLKPDVAVFNSLAAAAVWNGRMDLAIEVS